MPSIVDSIVFQSESPRSNSEIQALRAILLVSIRLLALTILYFICFAVISGALLSTPSESLASTQASLALAALLPVSLINTTVLAFIILRSRWAGWKLIATIFFLLFGVTTVMSQIETAFFITRLPPGMLPRLFLSGAIIAALFAPLAVLVLGKGRSKVEQDIQRTRLHMPPGVWIAKLSVIVIAYLFIYFTFGYFIAWKNVTVREYYGGTDPGSFVAQMKNVLYDTPSLLVLQTVRALMWTALAVPVVKMMKGRWWEAGLVVALLFGVLMNTQLLLPNPLMPSEVRMVHLLETATSNFLFGWLVVVVLRSHNSSTRPAQPRA